MASIGLYCDIAGLRTIYSTTERVQDIAAAEWRA